MSLIILYYKGPGPEPKKHFRFQIKIRAGRAEQEQRQAPMQAPFFFSLIRCLLLVRTSKRLSWLG